MGLYVPRLPAPIDPSADSDFAWRGGVIVSRRTARIACHDISVTAVPDSVSTLIDGNWVYEDGDASLLVAGSIVVPAWATWARWQFYVGITDPTNTDVVIAANATLNGAGVGASSRATMGAGIGTGGTETPVITEPVAASDVLAGYVALKNSSGSAALSTSLQWKTSLYAEVYEYSPE